IINKPLAYPRLARHTLHTGRLISIAGKKLQRGSQNFLAAFFPYGFILLWSAWHFYFSLTKRSVKNRNTLIMHQLLFTETSKKASETLDTAYILTTLRLTPWLRFASSLLYFYIHPVQKTCLFIFLFAAIHAHAQFLIYPDNMYA